MKAALMLEWLGMDSDRKLALLSGRGLRKPWCARLMGLTRRDFDRKFLDGSLDYSGSNSVGSRGIKLIYILESASVYEALEYTSWRSSKRRYITVDDKGGIIDISRLDAERWLSAP